MTLRPKSLLLNLLALPIVILLGGCGSLQSISINPVAGFVVLNAVGQTAQYTALGASQMGNASQTTSNITNAVNWTVGNPGVATISASGLATAVGNGHTQVMAESGGKTATSDVTVNITAVNTGTNGASITSISVIPGSQSVSSLGQTSQFIAIGATSTGATVNLTNQVAWSSSSKTIATVDSTGLATAVGQGTATLTALYTNPTGGTVVTGTAAFTVVGGSVAKLTTITIIPGSQSVSSLGQTGQFIAIGTSSTGATVNLTNQVAWSSSSVQVATIGATTGLATAVGQGAATLTALYTDPANGAVVTGIATFTVTGGTVEKFTAVTIIPGSPSVSAPGQTSQLLAIGTTSTGATVNLTSQVSWSSSSPLIATVGATTGLATAVGQGVATLTALISNAIDGSVATGIATFTVTSGTPDKFTAINITPASQSVSASGQTSQFTAIGVTATGATVDLTNQATWSSSSIQIATIGATTGLTTAVGPGTSTVTALYTNLPSGTVVRGIATITVGNGTTQKYTTVTIIPGAQSVSSPGKTSQFTAIGVTSTGATANLTNQVAWSSSSAEIAKIDANSGLATAMSQGIATLTAIYSDTTTGNIVTGTATISVAGGTTQQFTSMILLPGSQSLSAGQTGQFLALGTSGSTGLQQDVTGSSQIVWSSSIPTVATVDASGSVIGKSAGTTSVAAVLTVGGSVISATASVVVSVTSAPEPLLSLTVVPSSITVGNLQDTGQFLAIGTFSTVPYVRDLTNSPTLTWISSVPSVFPVNTNTAGNPGATAGIVSAYGNGSGVIIAEAKSSDETIQTATATFNCPLVLPSDGPPPIPGSCNPGSQAPALLSTLTVYNEGLNNNSIIDPAHQGWLVTAPSATGTPDVIHCGPGSTLGGSVCVATYPISSNGPTIILTAPAQKGVAFGGWSYNCTPSDINGVALVAPSGPTAAGPNYCVVTMKASGTANNPANTNITVGAIFN